jgi:hypothetical protein
LQKVKANGQQGNNENRDSVKWNTFLTAPAGENSDQHQQSAQKKNNLPPLRENANLQLTNKEARVLSGKN